jgi:Ser/Thr protein kinase RdoA (MazF antagonist)
MAGTNFIPVVSSTLSADALVEWVLVHYSLPTPLTCHFLAHGINDSYLVSTGDARYLLRVYTTGDHTPEQIEAEIAVLDAMHRHGVTATQSIVRHDGRHLTEIHAPEGLRHAVLFTFLEGQIDHTATPEQSWYAGEALARFHRIFNGREPAFHRPYHNAQTLIDEPLTAIEAFTPFAAYQQHFAYLREVTNQLKSEIALLPTTKPEYGLCHGDFMSGNLVWQGERPAIIDLDFCAYCWRVYDLATCLWLQVRHESNPRRAAQPIAHAFLQGYQSVRPLSSAERRALPFFVLIRHIWLLGGSAIPRSARHGIAWLLGDFFEGFIAFIRAWLEDPTALE